MKHRAGSLGLLLLILWLAACPAAWSADRVRVVLAGGERSVASQVVHAIGRHIAKSAGIELDLIHSAGSTDTLLRLREGKGLQLGLLQADVTEAFRSAAARGSAEAGQMIAPLRVVAPLYDEEVVFIVRADSPLNFVHEIASARINVGPALGGSALSVSNIYRLMFGKVLPNTQSSFHPHREALARLTEKELDVVAFVASRPSPLLTGMKPEARRFVKLLKFDDKHHSAAKVLPIYGITTLPAASYPNVVNSDLPALAVRIYLVAHGRDDALEARLGNAWCRYLPALRRSHTVLHDLNRALPPLAPGWEYAPGFAQALRGCGG